MTIESETIEELSDEELTRLLGRPSKQKPVRPDLPVQIVPHRHVNGVGGGRGRVSQRKSHESVSSMNY